MYTLEIAGAGKMRQWYSYSTAPWYSLYRTKITEVNILDSVTSMGEYVFYGCTSINAVHITDIDAWCRIDFSGEYSNPVYYAENLYLNGELVKEVTIPSDVTKINCTR